eukprot:scaffold93556_cov57-Attheya_sp.AAC.1
MRLGRLLSATVVQMMGRLSGIGRLKRTTHGWRRFVLFQSPNSADRQSGGERSGGVFFETRFIAAWRGVIPGRQRSRKGQRSVRSSPPNASTIRLSQMAPFVPWRTRAEIHPKQPRRARGATKD